MEKQRLQKYLASSGIDSRRKCEQLILEGKVEVNGKTVLELGTKIDPEIDEVKYNGKIVKPEEEKVYILLNKPIGYVTTVKEQFGDIFTSSAFVSTRTFCCISSYSSVHSSKIFSSATCVSTFDCS